METREFWTAPVARELPGSEQILFKERFANWGISCTLNPPAFCLLLFLFPQEEVCQLLFSKWHQELILQLPESKKRLML